VTPDAAEHRPSLSSPLSLLKVSLTEYGDVKITRSDSAPVNEWRALLLYFSRSFSGNQLQRDHIEVPLIDFVDRVTWLRENWVRIYGRDSIDFSPAVVDAVAAARKGKLHFANQLVLSYPDDLIDITVLSLKRQLTDFQLRDLTALMRMPNGANFSVPGAGKTSTTLALWALLRSKQIVEKLLVVCPRSAFESWATEPERLFLNPVRTSQFTSEIVDASVEILYVNFEQLENDHRLTRLKKWVLRNDAMLVIDEAHRVKAGSRSIRWRSCKTLATVSKRTDLLTGTPLPHGHEDLRNLLKLAWQNLSNRDLSESTLRIMKRGGVFVRTTKRELGLPPMEVSQVTIPMSTLQREIYSALRRNFASIFQIAVHEESFFARRGRAVMSLLAAASNPGLLLRQDDDLAFLGLVWPPREITPGSELMKLMERYARHEMPPKYKWVTQYVANAHAAGRKTLVWSSFVGNLEAIRVALDKFGPAVIHGAISPEDRISELHRFRNDPNCAVLITNPQTLGEGINLHEVCHEAIYIDRSFNAAHYLQSIDRIHRLGLKPDQTTKVFVLVTENSIDESADRRLATKIARLGKQLDDEGLVQLSLPSGEDDEFSFADYVDETDLDELYSHLRDDVDESSSN